MWSPFTSGMSSGTSASIRWLRELLTTTCPALRTPARWARPRRRPWPRTRAREHCPAAQSRPASRNLARRRHGQPPGRCAPIRLPGRSLAGAEPRQAEPRVPGELQDELLPHHPRRAQHPYVDPASHGLASPRPFAKKTRRAAIAVGGLRSLDSCSSDVQRADATAATMLSHDRGLGAGNRPHEHGRQYRLHGGRCGSPSGILMLS